MLLGCDIVQGFQDAGSALFPDQSTHLSTPALRLVEGGYTGIGLAAGRELSVVARPTEGTSLFVMRFANPEPCEIPDVGRFVASRNPNRVEAGIAYFHDYGTQGTLNFADTACKTFDFQIEDARLPLGETDTSVIVWAAGELLEVDPGTAKRTTLSSNVTNVITRAFSGRTLVRSGDGLEVFDSAWKSQGIFGKGVGTVIKTGNGALYLDATGLRQLSAPTDPSVTKDELLVADACDVAMRDDRWVTFYAPCAERRLRALHQPSGNLYDLPLDADPQYLRLVAALGSAGQDPTKDAFWFVFLRNVTSSLGTFVVRAPDGVERELGDNAPLDHWDLQESDTETHGYALVNVANQVGDYVYWNAAGQTRTLAHGVDSRAGRLLIDWDGSTGKLAAVSGDRLQIVAEGVPEDGFEFADKSGEWTVLFHDFQGDSGRLSRFAGTLDGLAGTPADAPFASPALEEVAPSVGYYTTTLFSALLPGTIFLANYDATTGTGRLSYENAELRFKATVDAGVSNYLVTSDYLLYTIPYGPDRGIWLATGK